MKTAKQWIAEVSTYYQRGNYVQAIDACDQAIALEPQNAIAYNWRGMINDELREYQQALSDYTRAMELDPGYALAYYHRGLTHQHVKDYHRAIADFTRTIELDPQNTNGYCNRGILYSELKDYHRAIADFTNVIRFEPHAADAYYHRGCVYCALNDAEHALADFAKTQKLDPRYSRVIAEKVLRLTPDDVDTWYYKGLALHDLQRYEEAVMAYEQVLRLQPNDAQAFHNKALALRKLERDEKKHEGNDDLVALARAIVWCGYKNIDEFLEGIVSEKVELPYVEIRIIRDLGRQSKQIDPLLFRMLVDLAHTICTDIEKKGAN